MERLGFFSKRLVYLVIKAILKMMVWKKWKEERCTDCDNNPILYLKIGSVYLRICMDEYHHQCRDYLFYDAWIYLDSAIENSPEEKAGCFKSLQKCKDFLIDQYILLLMGCFFNNTYRLIRRAG